MKRNFIISWKVFPHDVMVSVGETTEEIRNRIDKTGYKLNDDEYRRLEINGNGRTVMLLGGQTIIRFPDFDDTPGCVGLLAHEVFHAVCFLMDRIGVGYCDASNETFAYSIAYLTSEIYSRLKMK